MKKWAFSALVLAVVAGRFDFFVLDLPLLASAKKFEIPSSELICVVKINCFN